MQYRSTTVFSAPSVPEPFWITGYAGSTEVTASSDSDTSQQSRPWKLVKGTDLVLSGFVGGGLEWPSIAGKSVVDLHLYI